MQQIELKQKVVKNKKEYEWNGSQVLSMQVDITNNKLYFSGTKCFNIMVICLSSFEMVGNNT